MEKGGLALITILKIHQNKFFCPEHILSNWYWSVPQLLGAVVVHLYVSNQSLSGTFVDKLRNVFTICFF